MEDEVAQRMEIALAQSKSVEREARRLKQMLAGLLDLHHLQSNATQGDTNASSKVRS